MERMAEQRGGGVRSAGSAGATLGVEGWGAARGARTKFLSSGPAPVLVVGGPLGAWLSWHVVMWHSYKISSRGSAWRFIFCCGPQAGGLVGSALPWEFRPLHTCPPLWAQMLSQVTVQTLLLGPAPPARGKGEEE